MAYEASEIMFAAAMALKPSTSDYFTIEGLKNFVGKAKKDIQTNSDLVQFGDDKTKKGFLDLLDPENPKSLNDMAVGISAALATRRYMGVSNTKAVTCYMTGNTWPKDVEKFRVSAYGFTDYNSADVLVSADKKTFYGISLKKKKKTTDASPTLINKAFDSVLVGRQFDKIKEQIYDTRVDYFAGVIKEAVKKNIILKEDIDNFSRLSNKDLFLGTNRNKKIFDREYINVKGYASSPRGGYKDSNTNDPKSMRSFVNKSLAKTTNPLWTKIIKTINSNINLFSDSLINIILKTKLFEEIDAKDLKKYRFDFALVTGIGYVSGNNINIAQGDVLDLKTTLCGLTRLDEQNVGPYKVIVDKKKQEKSDAAKVFLKMVKGKLNILDLEIRYKGEFRSQPQWQGTLNYDFINFLKVECDL